MKMCDLFAGIGGFRLAARNLNHECVFSSEWNKFCQQTYQANFGDIPHGDITQIDPASIPSFDLLTGGLPCQPFSMAGQRKGFDDARGTLFFNVATIIAYHQPKAILLENVKHLRTHDKGNTFRMIVETLNQLGYQTFHEVINAKDHGIPQSRSRLYIVGFKSDSFAPIPFSFPRPSKATTSIRTILESNPDQKYTMSDKLWQGCLTHRQRHRDKGNGWSFSIFNPDDAYTNTLVATSIKETLLYQDNQNPRRLTPREWARLQGFPDSFVIPVSDTQAYKQFGNSVAVPVIQSIMREIEATLNHDDMMIDQKEYA